jgi:hypothetical protein
MGYPTEVGSEHERLREVPRVVTRTTHMVLFFVGKLAYVAMRLL